MITASEIQQESGDYKSALDLLEEATQLEPGSKKARQAKVQYALSFIRTKRASHEDTVKVVNKLLPIITRGAASSDKMDAADANAHIGWAYILIAEVESTASDFSIDNYFDSALQLDNNNTYAHAFWGYWTLSRYNKKNIILAKIKKQLIISIKR